MRERERESHQLFEEICQRNEQAVGRTTSTTKFTFLVMISICNEGACERGYDVHATNDKLCVAVSVLSNGWNLIVFRDAQNRFIRISRDKIKRK